MSQHTPLDITQFLQDFEKQRDNLERIFNITQNNDSDNPVQEGNVKLNSISNPNVPSYAYFLQPASVTQVFSTHFLNLMSISTNLTQLQATQPAYDPSHSQLSGVMASSVFPTSTPENASTNNALQSRICHSNPK